MKAESQRDLLWLSYLDAGMLRVGMGVCTWGGLERHRADRTLVEDFTVRALNVRLQCGHVRVHHIAVHTPVRGKHTGVSARPSDPCDLTAKLGHTDILEIALPGFLYFF